jgi:hypothetical protein
MAGSIRKASACPGPKDVDAAYEEVGSKTHSQVDEETAHKWASRAIASYRHFEETGDGAWLLRSSDYYHEAVEHAALADHSGGVLREVRKRIHEVLPHHMLVTPGGPKAMGGQKALAIRGKSSPAFSRKGEVIRYRGHEIMLYADPDEPKDWTAEIRKPGDLEGRMPQFAYAATPTAARQLALERAKASIDRMIVHEEDR